jgi:hypothetical protein
VAGVARSGQQSGQSGSQISPAAGQNCRSPAATQNETAIFSNIDTERTCVDAGGTFTSAGLFPKALLPPPNVDIVEDIPGEQRQQQHATGNNKAHAHSPYLWLGTVSVVA